MTNHRNDEKTVRCPVEGCDAEKLARGIHLHVRQSSGDGHGPKGETPEHLTFDNLDAVGTESVTMDYPDERDTENVARLCPYCSQPCKGKNGVLIHLGQVAGRKNHPEDAAEHHSEEEFPRVEVDEQGNITQVVDDDVDTGIPDAEKGAVPRERVYRLIAALLAENRGKVARRVRLHLLGVDDVDRPLRNVPPYPELYDALLAEQHADETDASLSAKLETDGIRITCGDESELLTAGQTRDIAAGLEQSSAQDDEVARLIEFLRYGADVLEGEQEASQSVAFEDWR